MIDSASGAVPVGIVTGSTVAGGKIGSGILKKLLVAMNQLWGKQKV